MKFSEELIKQYMTLMLEEYAVNVSEEQAQLDLASLLRLHNLFMHQK